MRLILIEGHSGSGKSTALRGIIEKLTSAIAAHEFLSKAASDSGLSSEYGYTLARRRKIKKTDPSFYKHEKELIDAFTASEGDSEIIGGTWRLHSIKNYLARLKELGKRHKVELILAEGRLNTLIDKHDLNYLLHLNAVLKATKVALIVKLSSSPKVVEQRLRKLPGVDQPELRRGIGQTKKLYENQFTQATSGIKTVAVDSSQSLEKVVMAVEKAIRENK